MYQCIGVLMYRCIDVSMYVDVLNRPIFPPTVITTFVNICTVAAICGHFNFKTNKDVSLLIQLDLEIEIIWYFLYGGPASSNGGKFQSHLSQVSPF